jgi:biotin carboxylase
VHRDSLLAVADLIDETIYVDFSDGDQAVNALVLAGRHYGFCGVVVSWEFLTDVAARVAAALGLRGPDLEHAHARRNKLEMSATWKVAGLPVPELLAVVDPVTFHEGALRCLTYPVVVKPAENSASFGVTVVDRADGMADAVKEASAWTHEFPHGIPFDRSVLVQDYLLGQEFSVEGVSDGGRFFTWGVTMKNTTEGAACAETGHVFPAPISPDLAAGIIELASEGTAALGITDGISHTEIKLDANGEPRLIETGPRPAGDLIPQLVRLATGESPTDVYVRQATGGLPAGFVPRRARRAAAIRFIMPPRTGVFNAITFPERLAAGEIVETRVTAEPGTGVVAGSTNVERVGWIMVKARDGESAAAALCEVDSETRLSLT